MFRSLCQNTTLRSVQQSSVRLFSQDRLLKLNELSHIPGSNKTVRKHEITTPLIVVCQFILFYFNREEDGAVVPVLVVEKCPAMVTRSPGQLLQGSRVVRLPFTSAFQRLDFTTPSKVFIIHLFCFILFVSLVMFYKFVFLFSHKEYTPVNLSRLQEFIDRGKLTPHENKFVTMRDLQLSGLVSGIQDGIVLVADVSVFGRLRILVWIFIFCCRFAGKGFFESPHSFGSFSRFF
jgi:hypothetical protein